MTKPRQIVLSPETSAQWALALLGVVWLALAAAACGGDSLAEASKEPPENRRDAGGYGGAPTVCNVPLADRVAVATVDAGGTVIANDEYHPVVLAPVPDGGSLVGWVEESGPSVRVAALDDSDQLTGTPLSFPGREAHAILAHEDGGVVAIVDNDPDIYSEKYCWGETTPDIVDRCAKLDLLRFDSAGSTLWRTTLTEKANVDSDGALFIWWYQHTVRLAWSGTQYGAYFRSARSTPRPSDPAEVDIHAGDTLRFVEADGTRIGGGWDWGCSHSWSVRLAYNGYWGAACHGDPYPNGHRLVILDASDTLANVPISEGIPPEQRALGGLVPTSEAFWFSHLADSGSGLQLHVMRIENSGSVSEESIVEAAQNIDDGYASGPEYRPYRAYMAGYADGQLLLGYKGAQQLHLAVLDGSSGELLDGPVGVNVSIDDFSEFVSYPNGDVGWAWSPGGTSEVSVVRVRVCE